MRRVLVALTGLVVFLAGCSVVAGSPRPVTSGDRAFFFAGAVPTYGQRVSSQDRIRLAYLRALRRIDVCGLTGQQGLSRIGEIHSRGTLFALDECDVDIKVPGEVAPRYVNATVELVQAQGPEVVSAQGLPVYEAAEGSCEYLVPLGLMDLPGAGPLFGPEQPHLRIGMVAEYDCEQVRRVASAIATQVAQMPLPVRDGAASYTTPLAERDPCEVLTTVADADIGYWNIPGGEPYRCEFGIARVTDEEAVPVELTLRPRVVDASTDGRELVRAGDIDVYLDRRSCSALVFVGPEMQRRSGSGELVDTGEVRIRPALTVTSGEPDCTGESLAQQVAIRAADLYR